MKISQNKATNDSAATIDEAETIPISTTIPATVASTEQPTTVATKKESPEPTKDKSADANADKQNTSEQPEEDKNFDEPIIVATEQVREHPNSNYSEGDVDLIARTVYLESGGCGEYCQWLTASTILNLAESRGGVANVVYDYNTFNVADMIDYCSPSDLSYSVAKRVISGDRDYNVKAFRADYYHDFGSPYTSADNVYFSTY